jgi:uncharacterized FlgJ-related protein
MKKKLITLLLLTSAVCFSQVDSTYYYNAKKILDKYPKSRIKPEFLYNSALKTYSEQNIVVPYELAIAQSIIETSLGNAGVGKSKNNPFSINSKNGYINYVTIEEGISAYYDRISSYYLKTKTLEQLLKKFTNNIGKRYASDKLYEARLRKRINALRKL